MIMVREKSIPPPPGYHFTPTDSVLINSYLLKGCMSLPMPYIKEMCERDLYAADPWDVLADVHWDLVSGKRVTYVLSRLSKVNKNAKRNSRRTPSGTWKGQTTEKRIVDARSGELIGVTKMFTFMAARTSTSSSNDDHWIMHEYSLAGVSLTNFDLKIRDYVICRITCRKGGNKHDDPIPEDPRLLTLPQISMTTTTTTNNKRSADDDQEIIIQDGAKMQKMMSPNYPTPLPQLQYYPATPPSLQNYHTPPPAADQLITCCSTEEKGTCIHFPDDSPPDFDFRLSDSDLEILSQILYGS